ncbi:Uncharacterized protein TCAP_00941 [Tolypocladium capitatum]|uniref:CFEM domain-containing protein n=1 Tax=Tolypocladium capitatum TaxID=45235 RepID=A0A2K3QNN2_9HYPO|nr:Uncharacterized protein TCAP_00941 [Tolypocladium capitatum]
MKSALVMALAASLVAAQDPLGSIPACARDCVAQFVTGSGIAGCKAADIACVCKNKDFLGSIACCLAKVCSQDDQNKTVQYATQLCNASGVQVPSKVVCSSSASPSGSATGSATGSASGSASGSATSTAAPKATGTATGASPASSSTGAAVPVVGSAGGLAGAVLAMLAVL